MDTKVICPECGGDNTKAVERDGGYECLDCQSPTHESWFWVVEDEETLIPNE